MDDEEYIVRLLRQVTTVSQETLKLVRDCRRLKTEVRRGAHRAP